MPEGHVIHRLARHLNRDFRKAPLHVTSPQGRFSAEAAILDGFPLEQATAYGKQLFLLFGAPHPAHIVSIHLGLIGSLRFETADDSWGSIRLRLVQGTHAAHLRGPQWCTLITEEEFHTAISALGQDPLRTDANPHALWLKVTRSKRGIGTLLMDQHLFAGVGNIYRAEALFRQGISPFRTGTELSHAEFSALWEDLVELMSYGVKYGRIDTVRPEHTPEAMGRPPRVDDHGGEVYVYRRAAQPCLVCGTPISTQIVQGRNLFWCPHCQPAL